MKFKNFNEEKKFLDEFNIRLESFVEEQNISLRTSVSVTPTTQETNNKEMILQFQIRLTAKRFLLECLLSYFLDEDLQALYRVLLEEKASRYGADYKVMILLITSSKASMEGFLLRQNLWRTPNEFFGWFFQQKTIKPKIVYKENRDERVFIPPNRSRVRGYRDKGSLGNSAIPNKEIRADVWITETHLQLEEIKNLEQDTLSFLKGFLE